MAGAFHKAAVAQRNSAWEEIDRLRRAEGHSVATALGQQETIEGLRAELAECIVALEKIAQPDQRDEACAAGWGNAKRGDGDNTIQRPELSEGNSKSRTSCPQGRGGREMAMPRADIARL
jgi:hypothetical protein